MTYSNSPLVTPITRRDNDTAGSGTDEKLSELRAEFAKLSQLVSDMAESAQKQVSELGTAGVQTLRSNIEAQPFLAMGVAAAGGALLALAVLPRGSKFRYDDMSTYNRRDIAEAVRNSARNIDTRPLTSRFERLVDSISSIDPSAITSSPAYDTAKTWLQTAVESAKKVMPS